MYKCVNNNCTGKLEIGLNMNDWRWREVPVVCNEGKKNELESIMVLLKDSEKTLRAGRYRILFEAGTQKFKTASRSSISSVLCEKKSSDKNCPCLYACPYRVKLFMKKEPYDTGSLFYKAVLCIFILKPLKRTRLNFTFTAPSFYCYSSLRFPFSILIFKRFWLLDDTSHFAVIRSWIHEITSIV